MCMCVNACSMCACMRVVCVRACSRACVRTCVRACVCVCDVCVRVFKQGTHSTRQTTQYALIQHHTFKLTRSASKRERQETLILSEETTPAYKVLFI